MTLSKKKPAKQKTLSTQTKFALEVCHREQQRLQEIIDRKELDARSLLWVKNFLL